MYRPNFCSDCGKKILRLHWHLWTSHRFCDDCARRLRKERWKTPAILALLFLSSGLIIGRASRPSPPPLIIQRSATNAATTLQSSGNAAVEEPLVAEDLYICGARTKKGTPCSRRVHGNVRCWQHKGMAAMLPPEKLLIKE